MKRAIILMGVLLASMNMFAQANDETAMLREMFGKDKKDIIGQFLNLNEADAAKFWPLYDAYSQSRRSLADERITIIKDYAKQYDAMTNDQAKSLAGRVFKNDKAILKLQEEYFNKVSKAVSPLKAMQFMQAELYLQTQVRAYIQDEIPFIGEFDKKKN